MDPRSSRATIYYNPRDLVQADLVRDVAVEGRDHPYIHGIVDLLALCRCPRFSAML